MPIRQRHSSFSSLSSKKILDKSRKNTILTMFLQIVVRRIKD